MPPVLQRHRVRCAAGEGKGDAPPHGRRDKLAAGRPAGHFYYYSGEGEAARRRWKGQRAGAGDEAIIDRQGD
jgi:hypothetical protein